ncbi:hypothetical protein ACWEVD_14255 [Nocardia thailandica]
MRIKKFVLATAIAIAAIGVVETTAVASPPATTQEALAALPASASGVDQGVGYEAARDGRTFTATLTGGTFRVTDHAIEAIAADGTLISSVPRVLAFEANVLTLTPRVEAEGTRVITEVAAQEIGYWRKTSPRQRSTEAGVAIGAALGGIGGVIVGLALGIATGGLLLPITLPVALIVGVLGGMVAGGAAGASVPNSDVPDQWEYEVECRGSGDYRFCW